MQDVPILVADINDKDSIVKLASSTKVLLSTAGPYIHLGTPLIRACLKAKTHYADINGTSLKVSKASHSAI